MTCINYWKEYDFDVELNWAPSITLEIFLDHQRSEALFYFWRAVHGLPASVHSSYFLFSSHENCYLLPSPVGNLLYYPETDDHESDHHLLMTFTSARNITWETSPWRFHNVINQFSKYLLMIYCVSEITLGSGIE